ncbi:MAG: alkaline phosphatase PhoX, partial [Pseudomonadota bacterium]
MSLDNPDAVLFGDGDELPSNHSQNPHFNELIESISRRQVLAGGTALGVLGFLGVALPGMAEAGNTPPTSLDTLFKRRNRLPFTPVAVNRADTITVPEGYIATPFIPWGTPITGSFPAYRGDGSNSAQDQAEQLGMHHDGMHFFPIDAQRGRGRQSDHGLLVLNHEYIDAPLLHPNGPTTVEGKRDSAEQVRKEINAHGVSVVEIRRDKRGEWSLVPGPRNRRITAATPMDIRGPARGNALLTTRYSPEGIASRGTQNNCASGFTPWGTYLTCEENWAGYFATRDPELPRELKRYGLRSTSRFGWDTLPGDEFERFDATRMAAQAHDDYRNEPNHFGWIVEIDPFDPDAVPVKR